MIKLNEAVIVEGKYDKIKLAQVLDALIIETGGFRVFSDKEKQRLISRIALEKGIIIMTDSDAAGFRIRAFLSSIAPQGCYKHVYIPDMRGKEKRKESASAEGKLGVEGIPPEVIVTSLEKAGVIYRTPEMGRRLITNSDLHANGFTGGKDSKQKRAALLRLLDLPERLSRGAMLDVLNTFVTYEEYGRIIKNILK